MVLDLMETAWHDVRYAMRTLGRTPGFSAVVVIIIAFGIGATTAIFTLLDGLMLRRLPVTDPRGLVELLSRYPGEPHMNGFSWKVYEYFRDHNHVFSAVTGVSPVRLQVRGEGAEPETLEGEYVAGDLFQVLGMQAALGRLIAPEDARADAASVAVVSWSYWKSRLNGNPSAAGSRITVNGAPVTVIGVTPRAFHGLQTGIAPTMWLPAARPVPLGLIARLKPGISIAQARAEMQVLHRFRIEDLARTSRDPLWLQAQLDVESAATGFSALRDRFATPLQLLMAGVTLLLLIACTNVASMLLARGAARRREIAVRVSLGASRLRLARQVLIESLLLSIGGSAAGLVLAYVGADALVRLMVSGRAPVGGWPPNLDIQTIPDARVLLFTAGIAIATGVLSGLAPALSAFRSAPMTSLREIGSTADRPAARVVARRLVAAQMCLSVVLLTGGWIFAGHLANLRNRDLGFERDSVLLATLNPQGSGYNRQQLSGLYQDLLARLQGMPGVRSATLSAVTPIEGDAASRFARVEGYEEKDQDRRRLSLNWVAPRYFETLGTPLLAGRDFEFEDAQRPRVAIVNQAMARHYFGSASPLGRHLTFEDDPVPYEIVGVAGDAKYADLHEAPPRTVYLNAFQDGRIASHFALRTSVPPPAVAAAVRRVMQESVPTIRVAKVTTLAEQMDASLVPERAIAMLSGVSGALGAMLAAIGLYGLLAYTVTRRIPEIGIRMALGATERDVIRMVLADACVLVGAGLAIGMPIALWGRRFAASLIESMPQDLTPIAAAAATMFVVALLAAYVPARRAARVRPMDALRHS